MNQLVSGLIRIVGLSILVTLCIALLFAGIGAMPTPRWFAPVYLIPIAFFASRWFPEQICFRDLLPLLLSLCIAFPLLDAIPRFFDSEARIEKTRFFCITIFVLVKLFHWIENQVYKKRERSNKVIRHEVNEVPSDPPINSRVE